MTCTLKGAVLTCSGTGALPTQENNDNLKSATSIIIEEGITSIPGRCFYGFTQVSLIKLPDSLLSIGDNFINAPNINSITIPKNVRSIGSGNPFDNIATLAEIKVNKENQYYKDIDGIVFSKDMTILYCIPPSFPNEIYSIPSGLRTLTNYSIARNTILKTLILPPTVREGKSYCFYHIELEKVILLRYKSNQDPPKFAQDAFFDSQVTEDDVVYSLIDDPRTCVKKKRFDLPYYMLSSLLV